LSETVRREVHEATFAFLMFVESEAAAKPLSIARKRIQSIRAATARLRETIIRNPKVAKNLKVWRPDDAEQYADHLVNDFFRPPSVASQDKLHGFTVLTSLLITACDDAFDRLNDPNSRGRRPGDSWRLWMAKLAKVLDAHGLPTAARKDTDKSKTGQPSPFVAFVRELQQCIPGRYRRSTHSEVALAKAITDALRGRDRKQSAKRAKKSRKSPR
jgi:hypothetical protein